MQIFRPFSKPQFITKTERKIFGRATTQSSNNEEGYVLIKPRKGIKLANSQFACFVLPTDRFCTLLKKYELQNTSHFAWKKACSSRRTHPAPSVDGRIQGFEVFPPFFMCLESVYPWAGSKKRSWAVAHTHMRHAKKFECLLLNALLHGLRDLHGVHGGQGGVRALKGGGVTGGQSSSEKHWKRLLVIPTMWVMENQY